LAAVAARSGTAVFVGHPFFMDIQRPREGYIIIPNPGRNWTLP
jgi:hypothetical protein